MNESNAQDVLTKVSEQNPEKVLLIHSHTNGIRISMDKTLTVGDMMLFERILRIHIDKMSKLPPYGNAPQPKSLIDRIV